MKKGEMLSKMLVLATTKHDGQYDRGGNPYILHPLKVLHYLRSNDEELNCIALGHDLIEDTDVIHTFLLEMGFSKRVADAIEALSKRPHEHYDDYKFRVMSNIDAMKVKMMDLRTNSDIRRLNGVVREKDVLRTVKYMNFYNEIEAKLRSSGELK